MGDIYIRELSIEDGKDIYLMLQRIGANENEFKNTANGLSYDKYRLWLIEQNAWSRGEMLPDGYVPQSIFWLFDADVPVGMGKIRHALNEQSRSFGGNIGYAIDPLQRGKGYGTLLLQKLLEQADIIGINEKLLSVERYNLASRRVIEKCGGKLISECTERFFFSFD